MLPTTLPDRFAYIINSLCRAAGQGGGKSLVTGALSILIWNRLQRMAVRFAAIVAAVQAGALPQTSRRRTPSRQRVNAPSTKPDGGLSARSRDGNLRLPTAFAWLIRLVPGHQMAGCRSQFIHLLWTPEILALLAAAPQLGRLLRGMCRMLGIRLDPGLIPAALIPPKRPPRTKTANLPRFPVEEEGRGERAPDLEVDPEDAALVEYILRSAETHPETKPAPLPRRRSPPAALIPDSYFFKPA